MLSRIRAGLMGISQLALTLAYWTPVVTAYAAWETMNATGLRPELTFSDLRTAFLLGASFMALSGYAVTVPLLYAFYGHRRSWPVRALMNVGLFLLCVGAFLMLFGDSPPGSVELPWILLGTMGVLGAEATTRLLWSGLDSGRAEKKSTV